MQTDAEYAAQLVAAMDRDGPFPWVPCHPDELRGADRAVFDTLVRSFGAWAITPAIACRAVAALSLLDAAAHDARIKAEALREAAEWLAYEVGVEHAIGPLKQRARDIEAAHDTDHPHDTETDHDG